MIKSRGAGWQIDIGNLGYRAVLTNRQMADLVNSVRTNKPFQSKSGSYQKQLVKGFYTKEQILDAYNAYRTKVKRK